MSSENIEVSQPVADERIASSKPYYSISLIVGLATVFVCEMIANSRHSDYSDGTWSLIVAGFVKQFFVAGQSWRILTGAVLHGGIMHLGFNCYALFIFGKLIEQISNRAHLLIVFLGAAISGGVLSYLFAPTIPSLGASGGIVGFLGYLTVYGLKRRKLLHDSFIKNMFLNIGLLAFTGLVMMSNIDNWAHLGGLIFGGIYGFLQIPTDLYSDPREVSSLTKGIGNAAGFVILTTILFAILLLLGIITIPFPEVTGFNA